jgi:O-acetylhomoserine/O-acetylserine sulfhydrylase-like pyridoxal-dependent enzyme
MGRVHQEDGIWQPGTSSNGPIRISTGVAALHSIFFTFLESGDHVIVSEVTYEADWRLFSDLLPKRYGIEATFVDISDLAAVREAVRPNTKLIHAETIANPTTKVADVQAVAKIAHDAGAMLSIDATFTPPPMFVVHSLTKYINGHGDAMGGAVIGRAELIRGLKADVLFDVGGSISLFNAWLIMRGSVTLPLRLAQHMSTARPTAEARSTRYRGLPVAINPGASPVQTGMLCFILGIEIAENPRRFDKLARPRDRPTGGEAFGLQDGFLLEDGMTPDAVAVIAL